jgi:hypothetical protein
VAEGHDDLGPAALRPQVLNDSFPQDASRVARQGRDALRVEEDHSRPADELAPPIPSEELHHEEIPLVIEEVTRVLELGQCLPAEPLQELEVLFPPFEGLLHRNDPVPEHSRLWHVSFSVLRGELHPIVNPASLKISLAMMSR